MIECPDIFELGGSGSWVLLASIAHGGGPNQWFTGSLQGDPPKFVPQKVGILDYGNGCECDNKQLRFSSFLRFSRSWSDCWVSSARLLHADAAKTGSSLVQNGNSRRVMFGFTGWAEPTAPQGQGQGQAQGRQQLGGGPQAGCGRYLVLPRELTVKGGGLHIAPVPETAVLRVAGSTTGVLYTSCMLRAFVTTESPLQKQVEPSTAARTPQLERRPPLSWWVAATSRSRLSATAPLLPLLLPPRAAAGRAPARWRCGRSPAPTARTLRK